MIFMSRCDLEATSQLYPIELDTHLCCVTRIIDQIELRQHKSTIFDISVWSYKHSTVFYVNVTKKSDNTILKDFHNRFLPSEKDFTEGTIK